MRTDMTVLTSTSGNDQFYPTPGKLAFGDYEEES